MIQQEWLCYKWNFYKMITGKLLFDEEGMRLSIGGDVKFLRGMFLVGQMSKVITVGWDYSQSPGFSTKSQGKGDSPHFSYWNRKWKF